MSSNEHLHPDAGIQSPDSPNYAFNNPDSQPDNMELKAIAERAYVLWEARGRPWDSSEEDWFRAEHELRVSREWSNRDKAAEPSTSVGEK